MIEDFKRKLEEFVPWPEAIWAIRSDALAMKAVLQGRLLAGKEAQARDTAVKMLDDIADTADNFYRLAVHLKHSITAKGYTQLATIWDMATVGSLAIHDLMGGKWTQLKDLLASAFSEASMIMASVQYIKAAEEELKSLMEENFSYIYGQMWGLMAILRKGMSVDEVREAQKGLDDFFKTVSANDVPLENKMVVGVQLYSLLLIIQGGAFVKYAGEKGLALE
jgi:hypothetical protein